MSSKQKLAPITNLLFNITVTFVKLSKKEYSPHKYTVGAAIGTVVQSEHDLSI
jgi:hypothetical protein